jgi:hypothetical protein
MDSFLKKTPKSIQSILGDSDSPAVKVSFILVLVVVLYILTKVILYLLTLYYSQLSGETVILSGRLYGSDKKEIKTYTAGDSGIDANEVENSVQIDRSINQPHGVEFTYTMWLNTQLNDSITVGENCGINNNDIYTDFDCGTGTTLTHIFSKGETDPAGTQPNAYIGGVKPTNSPGVYMGIVDNNAANLRADGQNLRADGLNSRVANLYILCDLEGIPANTRMNSKQILVVNNLPHDKWFHLGIIAKQNIMYVYINGALNTSRKFDSVIAQNTSNYHINNNSSVNYGSIADIHYYSKALNIFEIQSSTINLPTTSMAKTSMSDTSLVASLNYDWINLG